MDRKQKPGPGKLIFFCGKMGAGKTTLARAIARKRAAVLLSEDEWLSSHYPGQISTFREYLTYSSLIKPFVKKLVADLLAAGATVVMDFPANTAVQRKWFLVLCEETACEHALDFLDITNEQCLAQIKKRRDEQPERARFDTEAVFHEVTGYFEPPSVDEGVNIVDPSKLESC